MPRRPWGQGCTEVTCDTVRQTRLPTLKELTCICFLFLDILPKNVVAAVAVAAAAAAAEEVVV